MRIVFIYIATGISDRSAQTGLPLVRHSASATAAPAGETQAISSCWVPANRVITEHEGAHYQLRATRTGKLILTK